MKWDKFAAELTDTRHAERLRSHRQPCIYCGNKTAALSRVCPDHDDLPMYETEAVIQQIKTDEQTIEA